MMKLISANRGDILRKESPVKRGGKLELNLSFQTATLDEMKKFLGVSEVPDGYLAGWASTNSRDHYNHEIIGGAFQKAIDSRGLTGPRGIKLLLDHDWQKPAGVIKMLEYRRDSLWMEAQLNLEVSYVKERWHMLKMMGGANFSVGFMLEDYEIVVREEDDDTFLRIDRGDLFEVSVVLFPGNEDAQMTFVKAALHEDNPSEDELFFASTKTPAWKMGASKNLPILETESWDAAAVKARLFKAAGFEGKNPDYAMIKKAFLLYDSANPQLRSSYKLPVADMVDGKLQACSAGLNASAEKLPSTDVPEMLKTAAKEVLDFYQEQREELSPDSLNAPKSLAEFERALVAKKLVTGRNAAREVALVAKSCPQLFEKKVEVIVARDPALDAGKLTEMLSLVSKMKSIIAPVAGGTS